MLPLYKSSTFQPQTKAIIIAVFMVTTLSGCASMVFSPISEEDRDTSGDLNGTYAVTQEKAALKQQIEQWIFTCPSMQEERSYTLAVNNGNVQIVGLGRAIKTFVSAAGKFRAEVPLDGIVKESARSEATITSGKRTLIIRGLINPEKTTSGLLTWGVEQFGNSGCSARLTIKKR